MDSQGSSDQGARFQFIDISSTNARKEVRAHVMREFVRRKREEQPDSQKPKKVRKRSKQPVEQSTQGSATPKRARKPNDTVEEKESSAGETESDASVTALQKSTVSKTSSPRGGDTALVRRPGMRPATSRSRSGSPQSMVGASRRDPFQSLPMWLDEEDRPLVDHCQLYPVKWLRAYKALTYCPRYQRRPGTHV
jgi:hypothetical protein